MSQSVTRIGTALSAAQFNALEGVNMDLAFGPGQGGQITGYTDIASDLVELKTLGIDNIRTFITNGGSALPNGAAPPAFDTASSATLADYQQLAAAGVRFDFIVANGPMTAAQVAGEILLISEVEAADPGSILSIEGINESNNNSAITFTDARGNVTSGDAAALAMQTAIYADVRATPDLAGVTVLDYTTNQPLGGATNPNPSTTPGIANEANFHLYADQGYPGNAGALIPYIAEQPVAVDQIPASDGPATATEWGFPLYPGNPAGVTEPVAADYTLDTEMDFAQQGIVNYDYGANEDSNFFGLFYIGGAITQEGQDLANLNLILTSTNTVGPTATPSINATANLSALTDGNMMQVGNDVVVWAEPELVNQTTGASAYPLPSPINVTVQLGGVYDVTEYDPTVGITATAALTNVTSITVGVAASPIVLDLTHVTAEPGAGTRSSNPAAINVGSGPDEITVFVAGAASSTSFYFGVGSGNPASGGYTTPEIVTDANVADGTTQQVNIFGTFTADQYRLGLGNLGSQTIDFSTAIYQGVTSQLNDVLTNNPDVSDNAIEVYGAASDAPVVVGSGPDTLTVTLQGAEGTTHYDIGVNSGPWSDFQQTSASAANGETQSFTFLGNFTPATDDLSVVFDNNQADTAVPNGGGIVADPNNSLTVENIIFNGVTTAVDSAITSAQEQASYRFTDLVRATTIIGQPGTFITTAVGGSTVVVLQGGTEQVQAQGTDTIDVGTGTATVYANADADPVTINGGPAGSAGSYMLGQGGTVHEGAGTDFTTTYQGGMSFIGGSGIEVVALYGGGNTIAGGTGHLTVYANDTGGNSFAFPAARAGSTTIYGLNTASDIVDISQYGLTAAGLAADSTFDYAGMTVSLPASGGVGAANLVLSGITSAAEVHFKLS